MSELKKQLEVDVLRFFEQIDTQNSNDKVKTLRNLLDKYLHLNTSDYMMDDHDLRSIVSDAKARFARDNMPIFLGDHKRKVAPGDIPNLCVVEATIAHLNGKDCLKKLPKFDKREDKF